MHIRIKFKSTIHEKSSFEIVFYIYWEYIISKYPCQSRDSIMKSNNFKSNNQKKKKKKKKRKSKEKGKKKRILSI